MLSQSGINTKNEGSCGRYLEECRIHQLSSPLFYISKETSSKPRWFSICGNTGKFRCIQRFSEGKFVSLPLNGPHLTNVNIFSTIFWSAASYEAVIASTSISFKISLIACHSTLTYISSISLVIRKHTVEHLTHPCARKPVGFECFSLSLNIPNLLIISLFLVSAFAPFLSSIALVQASHGWHFT